MQENRLVEKMMLCASCKTTVQLAKVIKSGFDRLTELPE
jgi:hypothetical protein